MTDHQFVVELRIRAYIDQISGYPLGHPAREDFSPIVPTIGDPINREATLDLAAFSSSFSDEQKKKMLERSDVTTVYFK